MADSVFSKNQGKTQHFFGHGKILLTGEYFVLGGAKSIALPTTAGQSLRVRHVPSFRPKLTWESFDHEGKLWLKASFELWHFNFIGNENPGEEHLILQKILRQARKQNIHFLREETDIFAETHLGFPLDWGLGSSSTLVFNVAQWACISPFELFFKIYGGSGYDVACAQSEDPILYQRNSMYPRWGPLFFSPPFKGNLYFIYLGNKKDTKEAIEHYNSKKPYPRSTVARIGEITEEIAKVRTLEEFEGLIEEHENIVSSSLDLPKVKDSYFSDFPGAIKSLGAWEGDFILATSKAGQRETKRYFEQRGFPICLLYKELIFPGKKNIKYPSIEEGRSDVVF